MSLWYSDHEGGISIHAPRAGSDLEPEGMFIYGNYFNPRSPCGERHAMTGAWAEASAISIHAPRAGSDSCLALA